MTVMVRASADCEDRRRRSGECASHVVSPLTLNCHPWELTPAYDITFAHNPKGEWTSQHLMSVNGKFKDFLEEDLLEVADRFAIGTAKSVISTVRNAIREWPDFAGQAGLSKVQLEDIQKQHLLL